MIWAYKCYDKRLHTIVVSVDVRVDEVILQKDEYIEDTICKEE